VRLATWNVNSVVARLPRLLEWLDLAEPDVLCLQEIKTSTDAFPEAGIVERGYEVAAHGEGRWNGVAVISRIGLTDVSLGFPGQPGWVVGSDAADPDAEDGALFSASPDPVVEARAVGATCGPLRVWSLYVPNGRTPESAHYTYKLAWLAAYRDAIAAELPNSPAFAACGDFNVAPTDDDVWDVTEFVDSTHVTEPERNALKALRDLGLNDVIPRPLKYDKPYTYWDYRAGRFHKNLGMRIDLVYASAVAAGAVRDAYVDRDARKGKGPSDHAPVVIDLEL
jgi:exodeoxyribonuclease-3